MHCSVSTIRPGITVVVAAVISVWVGSSSLGVTAAPGTFPERRDVVTPCGECAPELTLGLTCQNGNVVVHALSRATCVQDLGICFYSTGNCAAKVTVPVLIPVGAVSVTAGGVAGAPGVVCAGVPAPPVNAVNATLVVGGGGDGGCGTSSKQELWFYGVPCPVGAGAPVLCGGQIELACSICSFI